MSTDLTSIDPTFVDIHFHLPITSPLASLRSFKVPVSWLYLRILRHMCFAAMSAYGELSLPSEAQPTVVYDSPTPEKGKPNLDLYYHVDEAQQSHVFPIDPTMNSTGKTTSTSSHHRAPDFRKRLVERMYIKTLMERRSLN
ncbi:hypothetical protein BDR07DRAFT_1441522 [Suillus spraguei]|nr:hypothetical protein BDR07DRAFT_1441522 [Suillus spraguei]